MSSIRQKLDYLQRANVAYRNGKPILTDADYDALEDELVAVLALCEDDDTDPDVVAARAFVATIGAPPAVLSGWQKVTHKAAMTSLNKARDPSEFEAWYATLGANFQSEMVVSDKLDGISCFDGDTNITLANGELIPIREVVENNLKPAVLTWDGENVTTSVITDVFDNGFREGWLKLTLEDGSTIVVTKEHLFQEKGTGRWIEAQHLLGVDVQDTNT